MTSRRCQPRRDASRSGGAAHPSTVCPPPTAVRRRSSFESIAAQCEHTTGAPGAPLRRHADPSDPGDAPSSPPQAAVPARASLLLERFDPQEPPRRAGVIIRSASPQLPWPTGRLRCVRSRQSATSVGVSGSARKGKPERGRAVRAYAWGFSAGSPSRRVAPMTGAPPPAAAEADQAWRAALASLYEMTRFDRPRRPVSGCEHCVPEADARTLMEVAREEAPERLMDRYGFKALTTWGDARDLRWFLPRLVELLAVNPDRIADPGIVADKAVMAGFATWPEQDRATLRGAFLALWGLWLEGGGPWRRPWRRPWREPFEGPALGPDDI